MGIQGKLGWSKHPILSIGARMRDIAGHWGGVPCEAAESLHDFRD